MARVVETRVVHALPISPRSCISPRRAHTFPPVSKRPSIQKLTFEKGLEKLEALVEEMESGELPLDSLIKKYEEGSELLKHCDSKIREAEAKIELLRNKDLENPESEDFDPDARETNA